MEQEGKAINRLTKKLDGSVVFPEGLVGVTLTPDNEEMFAIRQRLAAYEDAGLTPDQASTAKVLIDAAFAEDTGKMERIRELMKADEDRRVVVLPPHGQAPDNAARIRADIQDDRELAYLTIQRKQVFNRMGGYLENIYVCSDGCVTDDWRIAFDHELNWLKSPVKEAAT